MLKNLSIRNKKLIAILIFIAILIPVVIFVSASIVSSNKNLDNIEPTPMQQVPDQDTEAYEVELFLDTPTVIPDTQIEMELVSTSSQPADCFDCIALTIVEVRNAGEVAVWDYACGGFSGECNYQFKKFGYVIEALELKADSMVVKVFPDIGDEK